MAEQLNDDGEWKYLNDYRNECHEFINKGNEKLESIITQISSVFIGAIASFYAIISAPLRGAVLWALALFVLCIISNCTSYLIGIYAAKYAKASVEVDVSSEEHRKKWYIAEKLDKFRDIIDQIIPLMFISAIILSSIGTYKEYSGYIEKKEKNKMSDDKNCKQQTQSTNQTRGYAIPLKEVKPVTPQPAAGTQNNSNQGQKK